MSIAHLNEPAVWLAEIKMARAWCCIYSHSCPCANIQDFLLPLAKRLDEKYRGMQRAYLGIL